MEPYLGELRVFAHNVIPKGWAACNGALLPIQQNSALFSLLGITYGGNGSTNFALPDLRGRVPVQVAPQFQAPMGAKSGVESVSLTVTNIPLHMHSAQMQTENAGFTLNAAAPVEVLASPVILSRTAENINAFSTAAGGMTPLKSDCLSPAGTSAPHSNMPPFLVTNICIALQGIFPSRN
jgi:microcystin-dependent protein